MLICVRFAVHISDGQER